MLRSDTSPNVPLPKSVTYIDHDDPFVLADQASGDPNIRLLSRNCWVCCGDDVYVLECLGKGYIRVSPMEGDEEGDEEGTLSLESSYALYSSARRGSRCQIHRTLHLTHHA